MTVRRASLEDSACTVTSRPLPRIAVMDSEGAGEGRASEQEQRKRGVSIGFLILGSYRNDGLFHLSSVDGRVREPNDSCSRHSTWRSL